MKVLALALLYLLAAKAAVISDNPNADRSLKNYGGCGEDLVEFETSVLLDIDGFDSDPNDVTRIDWESLEMLFADSYNVLSADLCDEFYREVLKVHIERNSDGAKIIKRGGNLYSIQVTVQAQCRGCVPDDAFLFAPPYHYARQLPMKNENEEVQDAIIGEDGTVTAGTRQRDLKSSKSSKSSKSKSGKKSSKSGKGKGSKGGGKGSKGGGKGKGSKGGSDSDDLFGDDDEYGNLCQCDSTHPEYRPPTEEEFRLFYSGAIHDFNDSGHLPGRRLGGVSVDKIVKVTELEGVSCSKKVEEFSTLVSVEFFGDSMAVTKKERVALEETFLEIYNGLASNRCDDPFFRNVTLTDVALQADPTEPKVFIYIFRVDGTCRGAGCAQNQTLFADASAEESAARKLDSEFEIGPSHDTGAEGGGGGGDISTPPTDCVCPLYPLGEGAPTVEEFEARLFIAVQDLISKGILVNIGASGSVVELPLDNTPTPSPSANATDAPTVSPTPIPTAAPTSINVTSTPVTSTPTLTPTIAPTANATDAPSIFANANATASPAPTANSTASPAPTANATISPAPTTFANNGDSNATVSPAPSPAST